MTTEELIRRAQQRVLAIDNTISNLETQIEKLFAERQALEDLVKKQTEQHELSTNSNSR